MADDTTQHGPADASRINVHQDHELRYWTEKFGCTREQLQAAVKAAGTSADAVERHLAAHV